jgi:tRNA G18 (ribose-2'-O)-methylase SpoU
VIRIERLGDPRIADYRLLADPDALVRANLFVAEGRLVVKRLLSLPFRTRSILVTLPAFGALTESIRVANPSLPVYLVDQSLMDGVVGFNIHRGCLALAERPRPLTLAEGLAPDATRLVVVERVNNPDNIGGIFRSAAAFGVDAVVVGPNCSDPLYRKAIRTSMAATLHVPFLVAGPWPGALAVLRERGFHVIALTPAADALPLDQCPRDRPRVALLVGAEGQGLSIEAMDAADERVSIPMRGGTDSLNVAVAASIALYHFRR